MGPQKTPIEKTQEINVETDLINIDILGANRQFDQLELSLVYDKSDKHTTIYDSYNVAKEIKSVKLSNFTEITRQLQTITRPQSRLRICK